MKNIKTRASLGLLLAAGLTLGGGVAANAGVLDVWDRPNFTGTLIGSGTTAVVDVPDDRTRSARNGSGFGYSARKWVVAPISSTEFTYIPHGYQLSDFGSGNSVDHFDRVI
ncbi:hypothetical protein E4U02_07455 [Microbacterium paludicola]|jgi:hypothetical protein|uniref:Lactococcin 972 family bacteriocin n=1 Tax=Microbacterium paludicola TaxID=300019 RepID=A0A4Y9FW08_9MICO|nr:hypothetical protein [Microbacterium paludicola]MBF0816241.1 hypothetical protein [Microbacterium paludicola]TFU33045.1 hypothetical protein E4U02_07455 [Microbacterium paludicola]